MYRLFAAIELPDQHKQALKEICYGLQGAKWFDGNQMHLTLRFIGEVDGADFRDARESLSSVRLEPFELILRGAGYFPPRGQPKTIWVGVDANDRLVQLRNKVESTLVRAGFDSEHRKFHPHVALAKVKDTPAGKVAAFLREYALFRLPAFEVTEFCLFSSQLGSERAIHQVEEVYPLAKNISEVL